MVPHNGLEPLVSRVRGECVKPVPLMRHIALLISYIYIISEISEKVKFSYCLPTKKIAAVKYPARKDTGIMRVSQKAFIITVFSFLHIYYITFFTEKQISFTIGFPRRTLPLCLRGVCT